MHTQIKTFIGEAKALTVAAADAEKQANEFLASLPMTGLIQLQAHSYYSPADEHYGSWWTHVLTLVVIVEEQEDPRAAVNNFVNWTKHAA